MGMWPSPGGAGEPTETVRAAQGENPSEHPSIRAGSGQQPGQLSGQEKRAQPGSAAPILDNQPSNHPGSAGIKGSSEGTGGQGSAGRKSEELNPSGCKQIGQDCKAPNVGSAVRGDPANLLGFRACCGKGGWECGILQM